jgi:hypothetical protein
MSDFAPELPEGYHWQFCKAGDDITGDYYAESDADEARIWCENADLVLCLKRTGDHGYWGEQRQDGEQGLRKWEIEGQAPEGLFSWEQFEVLAGIPQRITSSFVTEGLI